MLDVVDVELAQVGEVIEGEGGVADGNVNGKELAEGEGVAKVGGADVVIVVSTVEQVVVTLSVLRHKGGSKQGQVCLIVEGKGLTFDSKTIVGTDEDGSRKIGSCLSRIVSVAIVIEKAQRSSYHPTCSEVEA